MPLAAVQVHLDGQSMRHAWHAELWADRLPVLAGIDPDGVTVPSAAERRLFRRPAGGTRRPRRPGHRGAPDASRLPTAPAPCPGWPASTGWSCPGWSPATSAICGVTARLTDAPVSRALRLVLNDEIEDWHAGERLVQRLVTRPHDVAAVHDFLRHLESAVVGGRGRVWPGHAA